MTSEQYISQSNLVRLCSAFLQKIGKYFGEVFGSNWQEIIPIIIVTVKGLWARGPGIQTMPAEKVDFEQKKNVLPITNSQQKTFQNS